MKAAVASLWSHRGALCITWAGLLLVLVMAPPARSASLTITVRGLPDDVRPSVAIVGPDGFKRTIRRMGVTTFRNVTNGQYRARVPRVRFSRTTPAGAIAGETAVPRPSWSTLCRYDGDEGHSFSITIKRTAKCQLSGDLYIGYRAGPTSGGPHFSQLAATLGRTCGLRLNGIVSCWGGPPKSHIIANEGPPAGRFTQIALHTFDGSECGLRPNGTVNCWNTSRIPQLPGRYSRITVDDNGAVCGITIAKAIRCSNGLSLPAGQYIDVAASGLGACGLDVGRRVRCIGAAFGGPTFSPPGAFLQIESSASGNFSGLRVDGVLTNWNSAEHGEDGMAYFRAHGSFVQFSGGCGIRIDGSAACGSNNAIRPGPYVQITSSNHVCALRPDATADCWFEDRPRHDSGETRVPSR